MVTTNQQQDPGFKPVPISPPKRCPRKSYSTAQQSLPVQIELSSIMTKGNMIEVIYITDTRTHDDGYVHPIRQEINKEGPFKGTYAKTLGLFAVASCRKYPDNPRDNSCLRRTTGKRDSDTLQTYPRCCVLRQISPSEDRDHRHKVLTSIAFVSSSVFLFRYPRLLTLFIPLFCSFIRYLTKAIQAPLEPHELIPSKALDIANTNKPITISVPQRYPVFTLSLPTIGTKHLPPLNLLATMSRINMLTLPSNNVWILVAYIIRVNLLQPIQKMLSAFSTDHPMLNWPNKSTDTLNLHLNLTPFLLRLLLMIPMLNRMTITFHLGTILTM
jgi:hypothetical protein